MVKVKIYLTKKKDTNLKMRICRYLQSLSRTTYPKLVFFIQSVIMRSKEQTHHFTNLKQTFVLARLSFSTVMIGIDLLQDLTR